MTTCPVVLGTLADGRTPIRCMLTTPGHADHVAHVRKHQAHRGLAERLERAMTPVLHLGPAPRFDGLAPDVFELDPVDEGC